MWTGSRCKYPTALIGLSTCVTSRPILRARLGNANRISERKVKRYILALLLAALASPTLVGAQIIPDASQAATASSSFDVVADAALAAMRAKAQKIGVGGVAVEAYFKGDTIQSWSSKMIVVSRYKDAPTATDKGSNLLAIAYTKAAEMADTLKDNGSGVRRKRSV